MGVPATGPDGYERPRKKAALKERLMKVLWTGSGEVPWEYVELQLCRDIYHCLPSQLAREDYDTIQIHLFLMGVENEVEEFKKQVQSDRKKKNSKNL